MLFALDTSTQWIGLALLHEDMVIGELIWKTRNHHSVELAPAVGQLFRQAGTSLADVEAIAVATGPGSFTSLRIGMAFVKGLVLVKPVPVLGIPTLDITAAAVPVQNVPLAAVLQAGRGRLAVAWYEDLEGAWRPRGEPQVLRPEELEQRIDRPTLVAGELESDDRRTLARRWKNALILDPAINLRRPSFLAQLAYRRWKNGEADDPVTLSPTYLHFQDPIPG